METKQKTFFFVTGDRITRLFQEKTSPRINVILMLTFKRISYYLFMNNMQHMGSLTVVQFLGWFARRLLAGCTNRSKRAGASKGSKCAESVSGPAGSGEEGASPRGQGAGAGGQMARSWDSTGKGQGGSWDQRTGGKREKQFAGRVQSQKEAGGAFLPSQACQPGQHLLSTLLLSTV